MKEFASLGLILNMLGVLLLFFFGFPQPNFDIGIGISLEDNTPLGNGLTVKQQNEKTIKKRKIYRIMSFIALIFLFIGFLLQLYSLWG
jgi:hypothetical protein